VKAILVTKDGTLVNPSQITTAKRALNEEAYKYDSLSYYMGMKRIKEAEGDLIQQASLKEALDKEFPQGKPQTGQYFKTLVRLSDGQILWVDQEMSKVKFLMERG